MRRIEARLTRYRGIACQPIWKTRLVRTLAVFMSLLPNSTDSRMKMFSRGAEKDVGCFRLVINFTSSAIVLSFVVLPFVVLAFVVLPFDVLAFVDRRVQKIAFERSTGDPRLRIAREGLVSKRKIDAPRSAVVKFDFDKAPQLGYRDEAKGRDRLVMLRLPSSLHSALDTRQSKRLFRELRDQLGLPESATNRAAHAVCGAFVQTTGVVSQSGYPSRAATARVRLTASAASASVSCSRQRLPRSEIGRVTCSRRSAIRLLASR